nr:immunoglobulin heavy chain junction region [Macaca mulatta]MOX14651.1 immunoglobulin heavy chain junction region [Macaca mulatta]MOX15361.1 immunoglobulin heavy chain junction region [Macaca mulatta]MOX15375.1 immunoglobulin heavy chain junction region [Macaca mulatta]MOX15524.1 immunoglobulin heavy chain junction region [Macaca mulatta]
CAREFENCSGIYCSPWFDVW